MSHRNGRRGNGENCFLRRNLKKLMNMGAMTLGRFIRRRGQTLRSGRRRQSMQSFCCIGQEAQKRGQQSPLTGQKRYAQKKAFSVCIKAEIFQVFIIPGW